MNIISTPPTMGEWRLGRGNEDFGTVAINTWTDTEITASVTPNAATPTQLACVFTIGNQMGEDNAYWGVLPSTESACRNSGGFPIQIVNCPQPKVTSVLPKTWFAGKSYTVKIMGTGFNPTAAPGCPVTPVVAKTGKRNIPLSGVKVVSSTEIDLTVAPDASEPTETAAITIGSSSNGGAVSARAQILGNQIKCDPSLNCTQSVISTTDGSPPPVQNAVVGQQIALTTTTPTAPLPQGVTFPDPSVAQPYTWTVGPTNVGGYTPGDGADSVQQTTLTNPGLTTYWIHSGDAIPVTYQYCVNIQGADPVLQCSLQANAAFKVTGPTSGTINLAKIGTVGIQQIGGQPNLQFGTLSVSDPGILFTPSATPPSGYKNNFVWGQLLSKDLMFFSGTSKCNALPDAGPDLDNKFPAPPVIGTNEFGDAPPVPLLNTDSWVTRDFKAQTYLLWSSGLTGSIPVPIGSRTWQFSGKATNTGNSTTSKWTAEGSGSAGDFTPSSNVAPDYGYPIWKGVVVNGKCY